MPAKYNTDKFVSNFVGELGADSRRLEIPPRRWVSTSHSGANHTATRSSTSFRRRTTLYDTVTENETYDKDGNVTVTTKPNYATSASQEMNRSGRERPLYEKTFGKHSLYRAFGSVGYLFVVGQRGRFGQGAEIPLRHVEDIGQQHAGLAAGRQPQRLGQLELDPIVWPLTSVVYHTTSTSAT